ncbi:hypothetical protein EDB81DRAFT_825940 [Dactylonectria macrodidyma]|uniref:Infection structure specific protein n=1 Tax=Dactylonectria macrodidyma TaxID=307937 RepID=A0A9P9D6S8_9HYPO|nr:hypothetical protein EDB81DRAFT_826922 [Dactylonectria macrodidyma]KAH7113444.1 hypothetical protein EDB81DRAFT_825940 [Dactylonectria macrodidyma]
MQSKILLATTLLATAASASFMAHPNMKREIEARATATSVLSDECQSSILDIYADVPTPPAAIASDLLENPQTDPCNFHTPASLSKEYASYSSEVVSWYDENKDALSSALSECPALSSYATGIDACETGSGSGLSSDATGTGTSGSDSASSTSESNSDSTGAASHQSGMGMAAIAVAGFVVAIL